MSKGNKLARAVQQATGCKYTEALRFLKTDYYQAEIDALAAKDPSRHWGDVAVEVSLRYLKPRNDTLQ